MWTPWDKGCPVGFRDPSPAPILSKRKDSYFERAWMPRPVPGALHMRLLYTSLSCFLLYKVGILTVSTS